MALVVAVAAAATALADSRLTMLPLSQAPTISRGSSLRVLHGSDVVSAFDNMLKLLLRPLARPSRIAELPKSLFGATFASLQHHY